MLEMDCVYNAFRQIPFEVGETTDMYVAYFKHDRPIEDSVALIEMYADHFGLCFEIIGRKVMPGYSVLKVQFR